MYSQIYTYSTQTIFKIEYVAWIYMIDGINLSVYPYMFYYNEELGLIYIRDMR